MKLCICSPEKSVEYRQNGEGVISQVSQVWQVSQLRQESQLSQFVKMASSPDNSYKRKRITFNSR